MGLKRVDHSGRAVNADRADERRIQVVDKGRQAGYVVEMDV